MVTFAELRAGRIRHQQRSELDVSRRAIDVARCPGRGRHRSVPHHAGHRLLLNHRDSRAYSACGKTRLRRCADAAAVLLQGRKRGRSLPLLQRSGATRRRYASELFSTRSPGMGSMCLWAANRSCSPICAMAVWAPFPQRPT